MQTNSTRSESSGIIDTITYLRDEIRLKVHLADLEMKEKWEQLEERLESLEWQVTTEGGPVVNATTRLAHDLKQSLIDFRDRLTH